MRRDRFWIKHLWLWGNIWMLIWCQYYRRVLLNCWTHSLKTQWITWHHFCSRTALRYLTLTLQHSNSDYIILLIMILMMNHDSRPTQRFCRANLSFVLRSNIQFIPINSITMRNNVTHKPERAAGVMLSNIYDVPFVVFVACNLRGVIIGFSVTTTSSLPSLNISFSSSRVTDAWVTIGSSSSLSFRWYTFWGEVRKELILYFSIPDSLSTFLI